jgi:hypothetical protein
MKKYPCVFIAIFIIILSINSNFDLCRGETLPEGLNRQEKGSRPEPIAVNEKAITEKESADRRILSLQETAEREAKVPERNFDMLYLVMVVVFLIASILLLFWNRAREKISTEQVHDSGEVTVEKAHLQAKLPQIQKQSSIDASVEDKIQVKMWYYSIDGSCKHGPVTEEELRRLLSSRRLLPDTLVWTQELPYWSEASSFKILMTSQESS